MRFIGLILCLCLMIGVLALGKLRAPGPAYDVAHATTVGEIYHDAEPHLDAPSNETDPGAVALLGLGFLLLAAYLSGGVAKSISLPKITGYLAVGAIVGPDMLGLVTKEMSSDLSTVKGLAVALIALNAGGELNFGKLREVLREVIILFISKSVIVIGVMATLLWLLLPHVETIPTDQPGVLVAVTMLICVIALANSPMVAIAIINESRAKGPVSQLVLILSIFKDIFLVIAFTVVLEIARTLTSDIALNPSEFNALIVRKVGGSILFGMMVGWALATYVRRIGSELPLVVIGACLFIALVGEQLHLKPLLVALAAGTFIENTGGNAGHKMIEGIKATSLPVYCLFFALAGVELHLKELAHLGWIVPLLAAARMASVWAGCAIGTRVAKSQITVKKYLWGGLVSQAGLSLAFATIIAEAFDWGGPVATLLIATIVINEVVGPIIFHKMLDLSGESADSDEREIDGYDTAGSKESATVAATA